MWEYLLYQSLYLFEGLKFSIIKVLKERKGEKKREKGEEEKEWQSA